MIKKILPIFLLIITLNGWATSRFSVYINGQKSGVIEIKRTFNKKQVITETKESLTLKRGTAIIKTENIYKTVEHKNGIPLKIEFKNLKGNTSVVSEYKVLFEQNRATVITPMGKQIIKVQPEKIRQDYGEEITLKKMIKNNIKKTQYLKFDQNILNFDKITAIYKGKTKEGYLFEISSSTLNIAEARIVDKDGKLLKSTLSFAGIEFKAINQKFEKNPSKKVSGAEIFSPSLVEINYFIPKGFSVSKIVYKLTNSKPYDFTIIETENQAIQLLNKKECILTVNRTNIPENATPDKDNFYLKSSSIINLENKKLTKITTALRERSKNTYSFIKNTVSFVYNYISNKNFDNIMASTDEILEKKEGDCTEHAFLATAIFRKAGIPSRCVVGLVMADNFFGYHMWVEVKLNGKWYPVDPTFNQLNPDPTHIRIDEFSPDPSSMKNIYKIILPLIQSISIKTEKIIFENGKTISNPEYFFQTLFNSYNWNFNSIYRLYYLSKKEGIFKEKIFLSSLSSKNINEIEINLTMLKNYKNHYTQDIKGKYVLFFENSKKIAFAFVHNSVIIIFVAEATRPVKIEKFRSFVYNKCIEVINRCQKEF